MSDTPDQLFHLDLILFASSSGMKLSHGVHGWKAEIELDGKNFSGYGPRPWIAVSEWKRLGAIKRERRYGQPMIYCQPCADGSPNVASQTAAPDTTQPKTPNGP